MWGGAVAWRMASGTARTTPDADIHVPAYGPVEGVLGVALFYVLVDRASPMVVSVTAELLPGVPASAIRTSLAASIWVVGAVTVVDQLRRQLAALGATRHPEGARDALRPGLLDGGPLKPLRVCQRSQLLRSRRRGAVRSRCSRGRPRGG